MAAALCLGSVAQAATLTGTSTVTAPGGATSVLFDIDFGMPIDLGTFDLALTWDDALLKLNLADPAALTLGTVDLPGTFLQDNVVTGKGFFAAAYFGPPSVTASSHLQVQVNFLNALTAGQSTDVKLDASYIDAADPDFNTVPLTQASATVTAAPSAVPEPASMALFLTGAGIGVLGAWGRRRVAAFTAKA